MPAHDGCDVQMVTTELMSRNLRIFGIQRIFLNGVVNPSLGSRMAAKLCGRESCDEG